MATIGSLVVDLQAETAAFRRDLGRARRDVKRFADQSKQQLTLVNRGFASLAAGAKAFVGVFAVSAAARGIDRMFRSVSDLADTADKLGVTAEELQRLRFAAEQTGVASNTLDMAIQRFTRRIGEAAQGGGELKATLDQYGIATADATGRTRDTVDILAELSDVIQGADSDAERLRIGFKAFDSEGAALVNTLRQGSAGLQELTDRAVVTSNALVARGAEIDNQWRELTTTLSVGMRNAILGTITLLEDMWIAAMPGTFRVGTDIASLEDQLAGLRAEATALRDRITEIGTVNVQTMPGQQGVLNTLQRDLTEIELQSFEVQQRLERLRGRAGAGEGGAPTDTTARDRIAGVTDELRFQAEQLGRTAEVQRIYTEARRAGVEIDSAAGREIRDLVERLQEAERAQDATAEAVAAHAEEMGRLRAAADAEADNIARAYDRLERSTESSLFNLTRDLRDGESAMGSLANAARSTVNAIINEFLRLAVIRPIVGSIFGGGGVIGIGATSATQAVAPGGTGALFQHGGSFIADGPGGTDAIAARLNVTKGERVTVETPAQQRAGRGGTVVIHQSFDFRGADAGVFARAQQFKEAIKSETITAVQQLLNDGGALALAAGRRR